MDYLVFLVLAPGGAGLLIFIVAYTWRYRNEPGGRALIMYLIFVMFFLIGNTAELLADSKSLTLFWAKLIHLFFSGITVSWLAFALHYSGLSSLVVPKKFWIVCIIPLLTNIFIWTNQYHNLYYREIVFFTTQGLSTLRPVYGPWFWVAGVHKYLLLIAGAFIVFRSYFQSRRTYQRQTIWIGVGVIIPILINALYVFRVFPFLGKDYTPIGFGLAGIAFFIGIFWHKLLHVAPIARNIVVNDMDNGLVVLDKDRRIVDFNPASEGLFSLQESSIGSSTQNYAALHNLITSINLDNMMCFETTFKNFEANKTYEVQIKPIYKREKIQLGTIITVTDITDWTLHLEEKNRIVQELERINKQLKETQLQLIHREKLASIGQMAAGIAHELNNPLSFLKSNYKFLRYYLNELRPYLKELHMHGSEKKPMDTEAIFKELDSIITDTEEGFRRIINVVHNLLTFSRVETSHHFEHYDLHAGIESTLSIAHNEYKYYAVIEKQFGDIPTIEARGDEINQVLLNLLSNAVHVIKTDIKNRKPYSSGTYEKGTITIRTRANNQYVFCDISNTGPSIPEHLRDKIFEPFFTTKKAGEGTGLGLSIAWNIIVKRHYGNIWLSTVEPTTFSIRLPIKREKHD